MYDEYRAYLRKGPQVDVHDGDTFKFHIDLGFDGWAEKWIRLKGIDTFELGEKGGTAAKEFAINWLTVMAKPYIYLYPEKLKRSEDQSAFKVTFVRYVADVWSGPGRTGVNLEDALRKAGHAKPIESLG